MLDERHKFRAHQQRVKGVIVRRPGTIRWAAAITVAGSIVLSGCSAAPQVHDIRGAMIGIGSSGSQYAVGAWSEAWTKSNNAVSLQFSPDGAAIGKQALLSGNAYFAALDAPLDASDIANSKPICGPHGAFSVPATVVPLGVTYNLGGVTGLRLDAAVLAGIYSGTIHKWRDPLITSLNPGLDLPDIDIVPIYSKEESVFNSVFTAYLEREVPQSWTSATSSILPAVAGGKAVNKFSMLATEVDNQAGSIAFMDDSLIRTGLPTALLKFGTSYVEPSKASLQNAVAAGTTTASANVVTQTLEIGSDPSYPLAAVEYQAFCFEYSEPALAKLVRSWGDYVLGSNGQDNSNTFASTTSPSPEALKSALALVHTIRAVTS